MTFSYSSEYGVAIESFALHIGWFSEKEISSKYNEHCHFHPPRHVTLDIWPPVGQFAIQLNCSGAVVGNEQMLWQFAAGHKLLAATMRDLWLGTQHWAL